MSLRLDMAIMRHCAIPPDCLPQTPGNFAASYRLKHGEEVQMAPTEWISTVENLIETCKDGEDGYREAARNVVRPALKRYFEEQSSNREQFADGLRRELSQIGEMDVRGSIAAAIHRSWIDLLASFGGGEKGVLNAVREGERRAIAAYQAAVATPLPPQIERLARKQLENIQDVYKHLEGLERSAA